MKTRREFMGHCVLTGAGLGLLAATGCIPEGSDDDDDDNGGSSGNGGNSAGAGGQSGGGADGEGGGMAGAQAGGMPAAGGEMMGGEPACPRVTARIDLNHMEARHLLEIPAEDLRAGVEKTYDIQAMGDHGHTVTVTVEDFAAMNRVEEVRLMSSEDSGHSHLIRVRCAPGGGGGRGR